MASTTALAWLLPATMAICAAAFLAISRFRLPAAFAWGVGFAFCAAGFAMSVMPLPMHVAARIGDVFFAAGFFFHAEAFLIHFSMPLFRRERAAFTAIYLIMNFYVVLKFGSLRLELLLNDIATACLLGFALAQVMNHVRTLADRAVVLTGSVVVIAGLIRVLILVHFANATDRLQDFSPSSHAQARQVATTLIGLLYVLSIGAALADRVIRQRRDAVGRDPRTGLSENGKAAGAAMSCDIDRFRQVNDQSGDVAGDRVIPALAFGLRQGLPPNTITARFGGEAFVAIPPRANLAEGSIQAQALRGRFAAQDWRRVATDRQITARFGLAAIADDDVSAKAAIKGADPLHGANAAGRNTVVRDGGNHEPGGAVIDIRQVIKDAARRAGEGS